MRVAATKARHLRSRPRLIVDLIVTESYGDETLGTQQQLLPQFHSTACALPSGPPRPGRARQLWGPPSPWTCSPCSLRRLRLAPHLHPRADSTLETEDSSCPFGRSCCKHDGIGKRGQTTLHRITPFFSWTSASSHEGACPSAWHLPLGNAITQTSQGSQTSQTGKAQHRSPQRHAFPSRDQQKCSLVVGHGTSYLASPTGISSVTGPNRYFLRCATAATIMHHGSAGP